MDYFYSQSNNMLKTTGPVSKKRLDEDPVYAMIKLYINIYEAFEQISFLITQKTANNSKKV